MLRWGGASDTSLQHSTPKLRQQERLVPLRQRKRFVTVFQGSPRGPAVVSVVEPTGSETQVLVRLADTPVLCAFRERITARPGETIHIAPMADVTHLFDEKSGTRIS